MIIDSDENDKIQIIDYDSWHPDNLGIFFYSEKIFYGWKKDFGIRSYLFKLILTHRSSWLENDRFYEYNNLYIPFEKIEFIHTCDLKTFIKTEIYESGSFLHDIYDGEEGKDVIHEFFDYEKLLKEIIPDEYEFCLKRLERKKSNIIPDPIMFTENYGADGNYGKDCEFLWLDEFSSFCGNFKQNNKEGCLIIFGENKNKNLNPDFSCNPETEWDYYDLPYNIQQLLDEKYGDSSTNNLYEWNQSQKLEFFKSQKLNDQAFVVEKVLNCDLNSLKERNFYPYKIWLLGTDDDSWSKWFTTEEEMLKEVNWLRKMQPINKQRDIIERGYIFTN